MKKIIKLLFIGLSTLLLCGCTSKDSMEDITIYTSIYPIEYITKALYGEHANIVSFYPNDVNPYEYKLTAKQMNKLSKEMFEDLENPNRPLFSEEATQRVMRHINEETIKIKE